MRAVRCVIRVIALTLWGLLLMLPAAISFLGLSGWRRVRRGAFWAQFWASGAAKIAGVQVVVHGTIPRETGGLLVSNHLGYLDILAHAGNFRLRFTPNDGIRRWPFIGWLVALSSPVWIDRKRPRKAADYARIFQETMDNGVSLLVYPEGTSSDGKHGMLPFKSTVFAAVKPETPIVPTLIFYHEVPADTVPAAWFDDTGFAVHAAGVLGLKKVVIDLYVLPVMHAYEGEERKALAGRLREAMLKEYAKHV